MVDKFGLDFAVGQSHPIKDLTHAYWLVSIVVPEDRVTLLSVNLTKAVPLQSPSARFGKEY